jgi:hypothetical protein
VLGIRDILVRIRIPGSVPLTNGSRSGSNSGSDSLSSVQCCGSRTFWGGSRPRSADPCLRLMDPDPYPDIFVIDLQDASKKLVFFNTIFSVYYFLKLHLHHFLKIISQNELQNSRNLGFSYYCCIMTEGSGSGSRAGSRSGSIPLTSGSGSGRPKNMWIRWIRIRIRIRKTASVGHRHIIFSHKNLIVAKVSS